MSIKTETPYGIMPTKEKLIEKIESDPFSFIVKYYHHVMKYQHEKWAAHHGNWTNTQTRHVIWRTLQNDLLGKDPEWKII